MVLAQAIRSCPGGEPSEDAEHPSTQQIWANAPEQPPGGGGEGTGYRQALCPSRAAPGAGARGRDADGQVGNVLPLVVEAAARGRDAERKREKGFASPFSRQKGGWVL